MKTALQILKEALAECSRDSEQYAWIKRAIAAIEMDIEEQVTAELEAIAA